MKSILVTVAAGFIGANLAKRLLKELKDTTIVGLDNIVPMQPGDVPTTYADSTALESDFGFTPKITLREGLRKFAEWYKSYYNPSSPLAPTAGLDEYKHNNQKKAMWIRQDDIKRTER